LPAGGGTTTAVPPLSLSSAVDLAAWVSARAAGGEARPVVEATGERLTFAPIGEVNKAADLFGARPS
jgi:hypothetical protein